MNPAEIEQGRWLVEAATPGPWHAGHLGGEGRCQCRGIVDEGYAGGIATVHVDNGIRSIAEGGNDCPPAEQAAANMHLIAWAGTHLPALLTAYEAAVVENARLREGIMPIAEQAHISGGQWAMETARALLSGGGA